MKLKHRSPDHNSTNSMHACTEGSVTNLIFLITHVKKALSLHSSVHIFLFGDFNVHHVYGGRLFPLHCHCLSIRDAFERFSSFFKTKKYKTLISFKVGSTNFSALLALQPLRKGLVEVKVTRSFVTASSVFSVSSRRLTLQLMKQPKIT